MAKKETQAAQPGAQQQPPKASQRDRYRSRRKESYPDLNEEDEEAWYGQANADLDELDGYRESNRVLAETFDRNPTLASMLLAAKEGENPFVYLVEAAGPDLDIRELINDPEFGKKMSDAAKKYQDQVVQNDATKKQFKQNIEASVNAVKEVAAAHGLDDEQAKELMSHFFGEIVENAAQGIVSKETWEAVLKARNYDSDIASARDQAAARANNERMQNPLKSFDDTGMPASLGSGGASATPQQPKKKKGGFASWGEEFFNES